MNPKDMAELLRRMMKQTRVKNDMADSFWFAHDPRYTHFSFDLGEGDKTVHFEQESHTHGTRYAWADPKQPQYDGYHAQHGPFLDLPASEYKRIPDVPKITKE